MQDTVGWFTTMHPLPLVATDDIEESLTATRASRQRIPHNGLGYGALRGAYGSARAPLPEVSFNYLGVFAEPGQESASNEGENAERWHLDPALCGISKAAEDRDKSDSLIDITARCVGDRLIVEVDCGLKPDIASRFVELLHLRLQAFSAHVDSTGPVTREQRKRSASASRGIEFEPYFVINETAPGPTLFVLPPGEGGAESYLNNLAKQLPDLRLVLFNNIHLHTPMACFEDIAQYYLIHIKKLQPQGPYNFFGWSFGGIVSLELSLQLLKAGESVSNLFMVDSFFNVEKTIEDLDLRRHDNSLDPINHRYKPNRKGLNTLVETANNILLFKAIEPIADHESEEQRRVFDYYARSPFNNLDTLIPASAFTLEILGRNTHFSWIEEKATVDKVCSRTAALVQESVTT
jgi:N-(5-amino-5-carboxypentanoyl)-L-cysteinyl-D-valine synthase